MYLYFSEAWSTQRTCLTVIMTITLVHINNNKKLSAFKELYGKEYPKCHKQPLLTLQTLDRGQTNTHRHRVTWL